MKRERRAKKKERKRENEMFTYLLATLFDCSCYRSCLRYFRHHRCHRHRRLDFWPDWHSARYLHLCDRFSIVVHFAAAALIWLCQPEWLCFSANRRPRLLRAHSKCFIKKINKFHNSKERRRTK